MSLLAARSPQCIYEPLARALTKPRTEQALRFVAEVEQNTLVVDAVLRKRRAARATLVDDSGLRVEVHNLGVADSGLSLREAVCSQASQQGEGDAVAFVLLGLGLALG